MCGAYVCFGGACICCFVLCMWCVVNGACVRGVRGVCGERGLYVWCV